jgi:exodeoxyribonuclease VII large subunit
MPEPALDFNHNQPIYSVSELSQSIKRMVEDHFGRLRIRGEVSGFKQAASGHVYFRLKDDQSVIDAVMWRGTAAKLPFKPEDGLEVIATGKITTYPGRSSYQIVVDHMEPAGAGALMAILEKRKKQLEAEGLFAASRKKPIPFLPSVVGVITSPTGAVIRDILHRIEDRFPVHVIVWPVMVQGEGAAEQVAAAIDGFNSLDAASGIPRPDVLIVARGGGSIEDLWAFNEEITVRAAADSKIPLISAVGHETDTTLIDFAADRRAPTPTAAAEMAVPVREELWLGVKQLDARLTEAVQRAVSQRADRLEGLARGLPRPVQLLETALQRLDDWSERLHGALPALLARKEQQLGMLAAGLHPQALWAELKAFHERLQESALRIHASMLRLIDARLDRLNNVSALLESLNYKRVLERGFALVRDDKGHVVTSAGKAKSSTSLSLTFSDGEIKVKP